MDDLISRQAAIDCMMRLQREDEEAYGASIPEGFDGDRAAEALMQLPSAHPEIRYYGQFEIKDPILISAQQWIPCSERLPEDYTDVLVWFEYFRYGNYNRPYQMYGIGSYSSQYDSWLINQETGWNELKVFAWMPLPEPYKGEQE